MSGLVVVRGDVEVKLPVYGPGSGEAGAVAAAVQATAWVRSVHQFYGGCKGAFGKIGLEVAGVTAMTELGGSHGPGVPGTEEGAPGEAARGAGEVSMGDLRIAGGDSVACLASPVHEDALVQHFLRRELRGRFSQGLCQVHGAASARRKVLNKLYHGVLIDDDPAISREDVSRLDPATIAARLRKLGAQDLCHVTSTAIEWDARYWRVVEILEVSHGIGAGIIVSCLPGKLLYLEQEEINSRTILHRP